MVQPTRRSVLSVVIVGTMGTAAAVLSGLFTQTSAAREFTFEIPTDERVTLEPVTPDPAPPMTDPSGDAVSAGADGQQLRVDLDQLAGEISGLNENARVTYDPILRLRNTGTVAITSVEVRTRVSGTDRPEAHGAAVLLRMGRRWVRVGHDQRVSLGDAVMPIPAGAQAPLAFAVDLRRSTLQRLDPGVRYRFVFDVGTDRL